LVLALFIAATGCAISPPVQEMSDARQAIRAAENADAETYAPRALHAAELLMDSAAQDLEEGEYSQARQAARAARKKAIEARDKAMMARDGE